MSLLSSEIVILRTKQLLQPWSPKLETAWWLMVIRNITA